MALTIRQCNQKYDLTNLLYVVCHSIENKEETRSMLSPQLQTLSHKLDKLYDTFNKDFSVEIQILNYLLNNVFRRPSDMKMMIKAFIAYNSAQPNEFHIPGNTFIDKF